VSNLDPAAARASNNVRKPPVAKGAPLRGEQKTCRLLLALQPPQARGSRPIRGCTEQHRLWPCDMVGCGGNRSGPGAAASLAHAGRVGRPDHGAVAVPMPILAGARSASRPLHQSVFTGADLGVAPLGRWPRVTGPKRSRRDDGQVGLWHCYRPLRPAGLKISSLGQSAGQSLRRNPHD
jgi:hypothetical protein